MASFIQKYKEIFTPLNDVTEAVSLETLPVFKVFASQWNSGYLLWFTIALELVPPNDT